ncbi:MAG: hypothetical protein Q9162_002804 [Coniocarpon cinnabarinum]
MSNTSLHPHGGGSVADDMEIASDTGQHLDGDIEIDLGDVDPVEEQDQAMDDDQGFESIKDEDDDMNDHNQYDDDVLNSADEELDDYIEDDIAEDVDVTDLPPEDDPPSFAPVSVFEPQRTTETPTLIQDRSLVEDRGASNLTPPLDSQKLDDYSAGHLPRNSEPESTFEPGEQQQSVKEKEEVPADSGSHGPEDYERDHHTQHSEDLHTNIGRDNADDSHLPLQHSDEDATHRRDVAQQQRDQSPPHSMEKTHLFAIPLSLHFAGVDNNLFPLEDTLDTTTGFLLEDRTLIEKPVRSVFDAFRDKFGQAIPDASLLGLEFPDLDMKINEESAFAAEAGCCLLSFVDLYVKLSGNDGNFAPDAFSLKLTVESKFYSRFQYLRNASNEGKGLSAVVQGSQEEQLSDHEEYDNTGDLEREELSQKGDHKEDYSEGDHEQDDVDRGHGIENEFQTHQNPEYEEQERATGEAVPHDAEERDPNNDHAEVLASTPEEQAADDAGKADKTQSAFEAAQVPHGHHGREGDKGGEAFVEGVVTVSDPSAVSSKGLYTSLLRAQSVKPLPFVEEISLWHQDTDNFEAEAVDSSAHIQVTQPRGDTEDEGSIIDYSDGEEEAVSNVAVPAPQSDVAELDSLSRSPSDSKKRKRLPVDERNTNEAREPHKASKRHSNASAGAADPAPTLAASHQPSLPVSDTAAVMPENDSKKAKAVSSEGNDPPVDSENNRNNEEIHAEAEPASEAPQGPDELGDKQNGVVNGAQSTNGTSAAADGASTDDDEELINYGSDFDQDDPRSDYRTPPKGWVPHPALAAIMKADEARAAAAAAATAPSAIGAPTTAADEEEEDLIDYGDDDDDQQHQ